MEQSSDEAKPKNIGPLSRKTILDSECTIFDTFEEHHPPEPTNPFIKSCPSSIC
jgi:hypothetical protein